MKTARRNGVRSFLLFSICAAASSQVVAQTYEVFHSALRAGEFPAGPLVASASGVLYGTTSDGGSIYALTPDGAGGFTYQTLHTFNGPEGASPQAALIFGADGNLYGAAYQGGAANAGTIFRITPSGQFTRLHDFADGGGLNPSELVLASDGAFYGTTRNGGAHDGGTIFRLGSDEAFSNVHDFDGAVEGTSPYGGLVQVGTSLYGTTYLGGSSGAGTIFRIDMVTGTLTTLHEFDGTYGYNPAAALTLGTDGSLYGTTFYGTVFAMDTSGAMSLIHLFSSQQGTGIRAPVIQASDGKFYGSCSAGGNAGGDSFPQGSLFRVDSLGSFDNLAFFQSGKFPTPAFIPMTSMADGHDGFLYGTLFAPSGAVYRVSPATGVFSYVMFLPSPGDAPSLPTGELNEVDGVLYGTTAAPGGGTAVRYDGSNPTALHVFNGSDGLFPSSTALLAASDGSLYGTTVYGGGPGGGTAYRITSAGIFESVHLFDGTDGSLPTGGLLENPSGELWSTTLTGGANNDGTVYRMDTSGAVTTVHAFAGPDGNGPNSGLTLATDGNFYGTTLYGGADGVGVIFRVSSVGDVTTVHEFTAAEGVNPSAALVQASDGDFYGVTAYGGAANSGLVYRFDGSEVSTLHEFAGSDGARPYAGLIQAPDGKLYGAAYVGGSAGWGTLFRIDTLGNFELLHEFQGGTDGWYPIARLFQASDGAIYGTGSNGDAGTGVVFRLVFGDTTPSLSAIDPTSGRAAGGTPVVVTGSHLTGASAVSIGGVAATPPVQRDQAAAYTVSPALTPGTLNDVTIDLSTSNPGGVLTLPAAWFADFNDVPQDDIFHDDIEKIFRAGITAGCGGGNYCRNDAVRRDQMAVFLLKAEHGGDYVPPACTPVFADVACPGTFADWIGQLVTEGVTAGCGGGNYCPASPVTRAQMAVFLLKTKEGSSYVPPPAAGIFGDVPQSDSFAPWIEEIASRGITAGCQAAPPLYCPASPNTRGQMAVFLVKTFFP